MLYTESWFNNNIRTAWPKINEETSLPSWDCLKVWAPLGDVDVFGGNPAAEGAASPVCWIQHLPTAARRLENIVAGKQ
jgi:hypothetical protein